MHLSDGVFFSKQMASALQEGRLFVETPSSYMFSDLRTFGGITNKEAAKELLTSETNYGGVAPRDRINERTFLSRQIVHTTPNNVHPEFFTDFAQSSQTITGKIVSNLGTPTAHEETIAHYGGAAAETMASLLTQYSLDDNLYRNAVLRVKAAPFQAQADKAVLLVMLFLISGCLADPDAAVKSARKFMEQKLAFTFSTLQPEFAPKAASQANAAQSSRLGLIRIDNGIARSSVYPLSTGKEGTLIGLLATGKNGINDVDIDVSRKHLRVFKHGNAWFAQGLGSTNGTTLLSGVDKSVHVVEPVLSCKAAEPCPPVRIHHGDTLRLGSTTQFLVLQIANKEKPILSSNQESTTYHQTDLPTA